MNDFGDYIKGGMRAAALTGLLTTAPLDSKVHAFDAPKGTPWEAVMDKGIAATAGPKIEHFETGVVFDQNGVSLGSSEGGIAGVEMPITSNIEALKKIPSGSIVCAWHNHVPLTGEQGQSAKYSMTLSFGDMANTMRLSEDKNFKHLLFHSVVLDPLGTWFARPFLDTGAVSERDMRFPALELQARGDALRKEFPGLDAQAILDALADKYVPVTKSIAMSGASSAEIVGKIKATKEFNDIELFHALIGLHVVYVTHAEAKGDPCGKKSLYTL
jgi:hypothetical protein